MLSSWISAKQLTISTKPMRQQPATHTLMDHMSDRVKKIERDEHPICHRLCRSIWQFSAQNLTDFRQRQSKGFVDNADVGSFRALQFKRAQCETDELAALVIRGDGAKVLQDPKLVERLAVVGFVDLDGDIFVFAMESVSEGLWRHVLRGRCSHKVTAKLCSRNGVVAEFQENLIS